MNGTDSLDVGCLMKSLDAIRRVRMTGVEALGSSVLACYAVGKTVCLSSEMAQSGAREQVAVTSD